MSAMNASADEDLRRALQQSEAARLRTEMELRDLSAVVHLPHLEPTPTTIEAEADAGKHTSPQPRVQPTKAAASCGEDDDGADATNNTTGGGSSTLYERLKAREDRARAKAREEYARGVQAQVIAEQHKREEAMAEAAEMRRALALAQERLRVASERLHGREVEVEQLKTELHTGGLEMERAQSSMRLLEQQLSARTEELEQERGFAQGRQTELAQLAAQREAALATQRDFTRQLQQHLGMKEKDLMHRGSAHEGVLREIQHLQHRLEMQKEAHQVSLSERESTFEFQQAQQQSLQVALEQRCAELATRAESAEVALDEERARGAAAAAAHERAAQQHAREASMAEVELNSARQQLVRLTEAARRYTSDASAHDEVERKRQAAHIEDVSAQLRQCQDELAQAQRLFAQERTRAQEHITRLTAELERLKSSSSTNNNNNNNNNKTATSSSSCAAQDGVVRCLKLAESDVLQRIARAQEKLGSNAYGAPGGETTRAEVPLPLRSNMYEEGLFSPYRPRSPSRVAHNTTPLSLMKSGSKAMSENPAAGQNHNLLVRS